MRTRRPQRSDSDRFPNHCGDHAPGFSSVAFGARGGPFEAYVCELFDGALTWLSPNDQTSPFFGVTCKKVRSVDGPLSYSRQGVLFRLLRQMDSLGGI
jgi:hypothetical protein